MGIRRSGSLHKNSPKAENIMDIGKEIENFPELALTNGHYEDRAEVTNKMDRANRAHKLNNFQTSNEHFDTLHLKTSEKILCKKNICFGSMMSGQFELKVAGNPRTKTEVIEDAIDFLDQYFEAHEKMGNEKWADRKAEVVKSIEETGMYEQTVDELSYGTRMAWRNAPRCIGRQHWNKLEIFDCRDITTTDQMFEALCRHLKYATNDGNIRSAITVFPPRVEGKPDFRMWNPQMLSYAGYEQDDGSIIGDPGKVKLTKVCQKLGWKGQGGRFDILPWVFNASGGDPKYYEIPQELLLEVDIKHPDFDWFEDMGLRWYSVPAVSDMLFDIGGIEFPAAPFNGWYMSSEIGSRNFCDRHRYNILEEVAVKMGLDTTSTINLWKDQALVEVNRAVIYSFQSQNVTIVDHHSASESFIKHMETEQKLRGGCPADWVWIVPPISGGITQVFHQEMLNYNLKPAYNYQEAAWKSHIWIDKEMEKEQKQSGRKIRMSSLAKSIFFASYLMNKYLKQRIKATILYASETGKSEAYANRISSIFRRAFNSEVRCLDTYNAEDITKERLVLIVTSTFGSGDAPDNGKTFAKRLAELRTMVDQNNNNNNNNYGFANAYGNEVAPEVTKFSVFALGSSAYPDFCAFGKKCDSTLSTLGCHRLIDVATADELKGEEQCFKKWAHQVFSAACQEFKIKIDNSSMDVMANLETEDSWTPESYRLSRAGEQLHDIYEGLSKLHHKTVLPCRMTSRVQLQSNQSSRQTILAKFDTKGARDLQYNPGDHLGVFPNNRQELVTGIARRLKNASSLHDIYILQTIDKDKQRSGRVKTWKDIGRLPPCSILTALTNYLDITTPPTQQFLKVLAKSATEMTQKSQMENLATNDDLYEEWKNRKFPNLLETLEEFDTVRLDSAILLKLVPLMQPRFYSISSSPAYVNGEIHATVGVVTYQTEDGNGPIHYGVCSTFLNSFPNSDIPCFIRKAPNFAMPEDRSRPILMVGPGTGVAPFRGFWQQRQYEVYETHTNMKSPNSRSWLSLRSVFDCNNATRNEEQRYGKMTLYFGCRHPTMDDIYQNELSFVANQVQGFQLHVAYSRIPNKPKNYVQDLLKIDGASVCRQLIKEGGHFYLCGEATMASEVRIALKNILEVHGNMTNEQADNYIKDLKNEGRFHEDIFGISLKNK